MKKACMLIFLCSSLGGVTNKHNVSFTGKDGLNRGSRQLARVIRVIDALQQDLGDVNALMRAQKEEEVFFYRCCAAGVATLFFMIAVGFKRQ